MGWALASGESVLEPAGTGSIRQGGSFWQLLTETTPVAPPLPKPCHANPQHRYSGLRAHHRLSKFPNDFSAILAHIICLNNKHYKPCAS